MEACSQMHRVVYLRKFRCDHPALVFKGRRRSRHADNVEGLSMKAQDQSAFMGAESSQLATLSGAA
jgi:hypothetical protein